ncbi:hypothetical protein S7711_09746 [Stachybotrys chartarum IBT 7711]|uniref:PRA1 family protein n=1 Tax=Stachybotrys chartarum (strain CBS 109288 / IBT 7711) TaxID=1280523 RepID=A0A084B4V6_STACB|nr:hypothetical protein S7711_09746 [Stachybotrys chartarum IBT 7711]KFA80936.1 hypothetical protein S40288_09590 [Stachybotrys chartarum IBT 40288]
MLATFLTARLPLIVPLILSTTSAILCALCLSAGRTPGFLEDLAILRLNTSTIGRSLLDFVSSCDNDKNAGNISNDDNNPLNSISDTWNDVEQEVSNAFDGLANSVIDKAVDLLDIPERYSLHVMTICEGLNGPDAGLNVTQCSDLTSESTALQFRHWPTDAKPGLDCHIAPFLMFALQWVGLAAGNQAAIPAPGILLPPNSHEFLLCLIDKKDTTVSSSKAKSFMLTTCKMGMAHASAVISKLPKYWQSNLQLISELSGSTVVSWPTTFAELESRIRQNLYSFSKNYSAIFVIITTSSILTHWKLLLVAGFLCGALHLRKSYGDAIEIGGRRFSAPQLDILLYIASMLAVLRSSPIATVISIVGRGILMVLAHAVLTQKRNGPEENSVSKRQQ